MRGLRIQLEEITAPRSGPFSSDFNRLRNSEKQQASAIAELRLTLEMLANVYSYSVFRSVIHKQIERSSSCSGMSYCNCGLWFALI